MPDEVRAMPAPQVVARVLRDRLTAAVQAERDARGDVHQPEDVYALVRNLAGAHEVLSEYGRVFANAAGFAKREMDEEMVLAVGEQDEVPLANLTVPDLDETDIHLTRAMPNTHDIDTDQLVRAVVTSMMIRYHDDHPEPDWPDGMTEREYRDVYDTWMSDLIVMTVHEVLALGTFTPQVTKVKRIAVRMAGWGMDTLAGVVMSAIRTTAHFKGVKFTRTERKKS